MAESEPYHGDNPREYDGTSFSKPFSPMSYFFAFAIVAPAALLIDTGASGRGVSIQQILALFGH